MKKTRMFRPARAEAKPSERWRLRPRMKRKWMDEVVADLVASSMQTLRDIQSLRGDSA
ncbi:hypothetical protein [Burkholderia glumae]|uniref:hypothetical protein n=1 Tax=Burkholderia glumae TaxID=337 RepID=UPI002150CD11|nr:hypothetical protein [Burkholderia glumae]